MITGVSCLLSAHHSEVIFLSYKKDYYFTGKGCMNRIIFCKCIYFFCQIIDFTPTDSFLDNCMFNQMVEHTRKHPDKPRSVEEWILKGSNYHKPSCVSATFDSLVKLGLLAKKPTLMGTCLKYPTLNSGNVSQ